MRKAQVSIRRRQKDAYALLMRHIAHADHKLHMCNNYFQDGLVAYQYIEAASAAPMNAIQLRKLRRRSRRIWTCWNSSEYSVTGALRRPRRHRAWRSELRVPCRQSQGPDGMHGKANGDDHGLLETLPRVYHDRVQRCSRCAQLRACCCRERRGPERDRPS